MNRYHVHGIVQAHNADVTISVDADSEYHAQYIAWQVCPGLDVSEIEEEPCRSALEQI